MAESLRDTLLSRERVEELATAIAAVFPYLDRARLLAHVFDSTWPDESLMERLHHATAALHLCLPGSFAEDLDVLLAAEPAVRGFARLVLSDYVAQYGLDCVDFSLPALARFTIGGTSEYAIRPFVQRYPKQVLPWLLTWARDPDPEVRRLASEGCRPRLPWGKVLQEFRADPSPILAVLETLRDDPSLYVRKSVANNLNDISKDHPGLVLDICQRWQGESPNTDWIIRRACRTLVRASDTRAMRLLDLATTSGLSVRELELDTDHPEIGEHLHYRFVLSVGQVQAVLILLELGVEHLVQERWAVRRTFKLREGPFAPGEHIIARRLALVQRSTRTWRPGTHRLSILANGQELDSAEFDLLPGDAVRAG